MITSFPISDYKKSRKPMTQVRGFRIRMKFVKAMKCAIHERPASRSCKDKATSRLFKIGLSLKRSMRKLCFLKSGSGYAQIGRESFGAEKPVPKGQLVLYIGENEDETCRVLVPVIYFNHPFFGDLLREAEKVYGFNHRGGIHVPCQISEFKSVQSRISAARGYSWSWRNWL